MNRAARKLLASIALGSIIIATPTFAQSYDEESRPVNVVAREVTEEASSEGASLLSDGSPAGRSLAGFSRPTLSFDTEQEETSISFAFALDLQQGSELTETDDSRYRVSRTRLNIVASAPIEEGDDLGNLFQGDSLVTGTRLRFGLSRLSNKLGNGANIIKWIRPAYENCIMDISGRWLAANPAQAAARQSDGSKIVKRVQTEGLDYEGELIRIGGSATAGTLERELFEKCVPGKPGVDRFADNTDLIATYLGKNVRDEFVDERSVFQFYGIEGTAGVDSYSFLDSDAFEIIETNRTSWEVSGFYGFITPDGNHSFRAKAVYGKTWELPEETELCRTFVETMEEKCLMGAAGVPISDHTGVFSIESRHRLDLIDGQQIAFAPQATYRLDDDSFGVELPVYLTADDDGNLSGGIKLGYNSKDDDVAIGVFIGVPFNVNF